jgi:hypothetical protein
MMQKLALEWFFDPVLKGTEQLQAQLKPTVSDWAKAAYPKLLSRLKNDSLSNNSSALEIIPVRVQETSVWLFVSMCVNRTLPSDCTVFVGATQETAEKAADGFLSEMEERNAAHINRVGSQYVDGSLLVLKNISRDEFHSLYHGPTLPFLQEIEWFSDSIARVLGTVIHDLVDDDFSYVVLGRDECGLFRAIDLRASIKSQEQAGEALREKMKEHLRTGAESFPQGDC